MTDAERRRPRLGRGRLAPRGAASALVAAAAAATVFLAALALAAGAGAARIAGAWEGAGEGRATARIPAQAGAEGARAAAEALRAAPGVASIEPLDPEAVAALLAPWLGEGFDAAALPLPAMIDVRLAPGADLEAMAAGFSAAVPGAVLEGSGRWAAPLREAAGSLRRLAHASAALCAGALAALVALGARAAVGEAGATVRTLRLLGAEDGFVAAAIERPIVLSAAAGGALGGAGAAAAIATARAADLVPALGAVGEGSAGLALWPALAAPLAAAALAWLAARAALLSSLRRIEG